MTTNISVTAARFQLERAQRALDLAVQEQEKVAAFGEPQVLFMVMAKTPIYLQGVSYPKTGVAAAIFKDEAKARAYAAEVTPPAGAHYVVEPVTFYS